MLTTTPMGPGWFIFFQRTEDYGGSQFRNPLVRRVLEIHEEEIKEDLDRDYELTLIELDTVTEKVELLEEEKAIYLSKSASLPNEIVGFEPKKDVLNEKILKAKSDIEGVKLELANIKKQYKKIETLAIDRMGDDELALLLIIYETA